MLPIFLKKKDQKAAGISEPIFRKPDEPEEPTEEANSEDVMLRAVAGEVLKAVEAKNPKDLAVALKAMFEILESRPHVEYGEEAHGETE